MGEQKQVLIMLSAMWTFLQKQLIYSFQTGGERSKLRVVDLGCLGELYC